MRRAAAVVDLGAIGANLATITGLAGNATVMAVVKADAYGHGMAPVARAARRVRGRVARRGPAVRGAGAAGQRRPGPHPRLAVVAG